MEPFIRVRKALFSVKKVFIMNTFVLLSFLFSFVLFFMPASLIYLHSTFFLCVALLYFYMMVEDFNCQTVDMRIWSVLFLCMQLYNSFSLRFYMEYIIGMFIFCIIYSCSWKIKQESGTSIESEKYPILQSQFGFLPSIGVALVIWYLFKDKIPIPTVDMFEIYANILTTPVFIISCVCISFYLFYRERKLYIAEKKQRPIQYNMGGGDVWVCGAWFAFLGFVKFFVVIFIALCIHALFYSIYYFFQKRELNEIKR